MQLLDRDSFREGVFKRDKHKCVICKEKAVDAHHIMERKLFANGGYYLDNGASLCEVHHRQAEDTRLSCEQIRDAAGIKNVILPSHLDPVGRYDKWGNEFVGEKRYMGEYFKTLFVRDPVLLGIYIDAVIKMEMKYTKYPRTPHLPWSETCTDDDKRLANVDHFIGKEVIASIKMDGENTTMYDDKIHARSLTPDNHPSRDWVKGFWGQRAYMIPSDWRICGENVYALHTIPYENLQSYFLTISIWDNNRCMDWANTVEWCKLLELETVPVFYRGIFDEKLIHSLFPDKYKGDDTEGYVIRLADGFYYDDFGTSVAKFVSKRFKIDTSKHWMQGQVIPNKLEKKEDGTA